VCPKGTTFSHNRYTEEGLSSSEFDRPLVLDLPDECYFSRQGVDYCHRGGQVAFDDDRFVSWVLGQHKS
jgi:hypothetical protein